MKGMDYDLISAISRDVDVPVTVCGGIGSVRHGQLAIGAGADAIALGSALHYNRVTFEELRNAITAESESMSGAMPERNAA